MTSPRRWIWRSIALQVAGLVFDAVWHGVLDPGFEATSVGEMAAHLGTVHLPIYFGVLAVALSTAGALGAARRRGSRTALRVAFAGALLAVAGEAGHAYTHLQLSTHAGPIAEGTALLGLVIVVVATWLSGRGERRAAGELDRRRAA